MATLTKTSFLALALFGALPGAIRAWNAARTSVDNQWGHAPTMSEGIPAHVRVSGQVGLRMYALDASSKRTKEVPNASTIVINGGIILGSPSDFNVGPEFKTVWYEIGECEAPSPACGGGTGAERSAERAEVTRQGGGLLRL